jgi:hypothetical protein
MTFRQQQAQLTLLDWLRVEYAIGKPSNKLLVVAELDSDTWVGEVKRIRGKKPLRPPPCDFYFPVLRSQTAEGGLLSQFRLFSPLAPHAHPAIWNSDGEFEALLAQPYRRSRQRNSLGLQNFRRHRHLLHCASHLYSHGYL